MAREKTGTTTITYRFHLYEKHLQWFACTKQLYNRVVAHYYGILRKRQELMSLSGHELLRELERLSVGTKEMKAACLKPDYPLADFPKIPLYFRRAAINNAAGLMRSYISRHRRWELLTESGRQAGNEPSHPSEFQISPVYYKGMYREWKERSVELKLYDGKTWRWDTYRYKGRELPEGAVCQSPTIVVEKKQVILHVPVELPVCDTRTVKERMETEQVICAVAFPDYDVLAAGVLLDRQGRKLSEKTFRGGNAREGQRGEILEKLEKSQRSRGNGRRECRSPMETDRAYKVDCRQQKQEAGTDGVTGAEAPATGAEAGMPGRENAVLYDKLSKINRYYAHQISREIVDYCVRNGVKIIVVPDYGDAIDFAGKGYLSTNGFRWQGRAIIKNLRYKAYREGIVVTSVSSHHISDRCSECGEEIKKYNEGHRAGKNYYGGKLFVCPNGHRGNSAINTAGNIGRYFLRGYPQETEKENVEGTGLE
ncbi:MAG: transposase [Lachnospiraceae bacterium]|nr:transposase [Lachnospiraceae bacterium]